MAKTLTVADVISSRKPKDVLIPWEDGEVKLRIKPLTFGEMQLITKGKTGKGREQEIGIDLMMQCARKIEDDGKGVLVEKEFTREEIDKSPPGFILRVMNEVNMAAGISIPIEELKNL